MGKELNAFISEIKRSLPSNGLEPMLVKVSNGIRYYYDNEKYGSPLKKCFKALKIDSKEFVPVRGHDNLKICSVSSSARLCFLYFQGDERKDRVEIEYHLENPTGRGNDAQPDAKIGDTYYECKCQEIVEGEDEELSEKYVKHLLTFFDLDNTNANMETVSGFLKGYNINYDGNYKRTHFHVKQLFTHLISIAKKHQNEDKKVALQYVFFTPTEEKQSESTKRIYAELNAEISAIWNSKALSRFKEKKPNIELPEPLFIPVSNVCFAKNPEDILKEIVLKEL